MHRFYIPEKKLGGYVLEIEDAEIVHQISKVFRAHE
jgi:hypothetical protein